MQRNSQSEPVSSTNVNKMYDPLEELFVAQSAKPVHLGEINLRALTPFHRALLVIDGTVTKFIEAYNLDPIEVIKINQEERILSTDHPWLDASKGLPVITREVILRGKYSYQVYAYAISLIVTDRLPLNVQDALKSQKIGIGQALLSSRMETYREVLWYGKEQPDQLPAIIMEFENKEFISRTYRIIVKNQPLMLINEKFPIDINLHRFDDY